MDIPLEVSFRNMDRSDAVEARVRKRAAKLEKFGARITSCRVVIEAPERRHHKGNLFHVRIEIGVPGRPDLVVSRHPKDRHAHEDVHIAVRDAFDAVRRQLEDYMRRIGGSAKTHELPMHGKVAQLFPDRNYGFVETSDGREVYFHRNAVVKGVFDRLKVGNEVRLSVVDGESAQGPQASTVQPIGRHHLVD